MLFGAHFLRSLTERDAADGVMMARVGWRELGASFSKIPNSIRSTNLEPRNPRARAAMAARCTLHTLQSAVVVSCFPCPFGRLLVSQYETSCHYCVVFSL